MKEKNKLELNPLDGLLRRLIMLRKQEQHTLKDYCTNLIRPISTNDEHIQCIMSPIWSEGTTKLVSLFMESLSNILKDFTETKNLYIELSKHYNQDFSAEIDVLEKLAVWIPKNVHFGLDTKEMYKQVAEEAETLTIIGPTEVYIKEKWETLCDLHSIIIREHHGFLIEDTTPKSNFELNAGEKKTLELLMRFFEDGASKYPCLQHMVMSWPFMNYMPNPPKDEFPNFEFPKGARSNPYFFHILIPDVLLSRGTLTKSWLIDSAKSSWEFNIGRNRFMALATEAGEIIGRVLFDYNRQPLLRDITYTYLWLRSIHLLRRTLLTDDGWDGLFDEDSDFSEEGFRKGLYKFWKSKDAFLDSAFVCNMLLNNAISRELDEQNILPKHVEIAYQCYQIAEKDLAERKPGVTTTDQNIYDHIREMDLYEDSYYELRGFLTFKRYISKARQHYGTQKNAPRAGRAGRSIVKADEIEYNSSQKGD